MLWCYYVSVLRGALIDLCILAVHTTKSDTGPTYSYLADRRA